MAIQAQNVNDLVSCKPARPFLRKRRGLLILAATLAIASLLILNFVRWKMIGAAPEQSLQLQHTPSA
jgi:hypothetical protein